MLAAGTLGVGAADLAAADGGGSDGVNSVERIVFQPGASKATFRDYNPGGTNRYLVRGGPDQQMTVQIAPEDGAPTFDIYAPDGTVLATDQTDTTVTPRRRG